MGASNCAFSMFIVTASSRDVKGFGHTPGSATQQPRTGLLTIFCDAAGFHAEKLGFLLALSCLHAHIGSTVGSSRWREPMNLR